MLWDDFINSYWRDWRTGDRSGDRDRLDDPQWLAEWLERHGLPAAAPATQEELQHLKQLRSLLWTEVQQLVQGVAPDQTLLDQLNSYMTAGPVIRQIVTPPASLQSSSSSPSAVIGNRSWPRSPPLLPRLCWRRNCPASVSATIRTVSGCTTMIRVTVRNGTVMIKCAGI